MLNHGVFISPQPAGDRAGRIAIVKRKGNGTKIHRNRLGEKIQHKVVGIPGIVARIFQPQIDELQLRPIEHQNPRRKTAMSTMLVSQNQGTLPILGQPFDDPTLDVEPENLSVTVHHVTDVLDLEIEGLNHVRKRLTNCFQMNRVSQTLAIRARNTGNRACNRKSP